MMRGVALAGAFLVSFVLGAVTSPSPRDRESTSGDGRPSAQQSGAPLTGVAEEPEVRQICGTTCHRLPPPDILPTASWRDEIARMALIRADLPEPAGPPGTAARSIALTEDMQRVLRYYQAHAPGSLPHPSPWPVADASMFLRRGLPGADITAAPAVSHVRVLDLDGDGRLQIVASDMRSGLLLAAAAPWARLETIGRVANPAHFSLFDLDGDGARDLLVADLGSFQPADHTQGAVTWLRRRTAGKDGDCKPPCSREYIPLSIEGWPRVADVEAADFNRDGKPDLAVASFGWRKVGRLSVLENRTDSYDRPSFTDHVIDPRSGAIHAIPVDLNNDGHLDLVTLFAQQYETVVAYLGTGREFEFTSHEIFTAPHPNWGSSGIQVVDLDRDGDLDVLLSHGDTFDDQIIKPYHGVEWLENRGQFPFIEHRLADLPGVFRAQAGDLDGDGDLDIVACAFVAGGSNVDESTLPSLVWLEQVRPGIFERRTLERKPPRHATLDLADIDGDADLDIVVGNFVTDANVAPPVEIWENKLRSPR